MLRIRIQPELLDLTCAGPARLLDLVDDLEVAHLPLSCRGGRCCICRVHVLAGADQLEPASARERETLHFAHAAGDERLACQIWLRPDAAGELTLKLSSSDEPVES